MSHVCYAEFDDGTYLETSSHGSNMAACQQLVQMAQQKNPHAHAAFDPKGKNQCALHVVRPDGNQEVPDAGCLKTSDPLKVQQIGFTGWR